MADWLARVPNADAAAMPNGTITIPGDEEHSVSAWKERKKNQKICQFLLL